MCLKNNKAMGATRGYEHTRNPTRTAVFLLPLPAMENRNHPPALKELGPLHLRRLRRQAVYAKDAD
jgi:hypothetical protein